MADAEMAEPTAFEQLGDSPVKLTGLVAHWRACELWKGTTRLLELAGSSQVQVMVAPRGGPFVGDMEHLLLMPCTFGEFLDGSLQRQLEARHLGTRPAMYLAQCPILEGGDRPGELAPLAADIDTPPIIGCAPISNINFWASMRETRSSLHYDPYSNMLCVAAGTKTVWLLPPGMTGSLAAQPAYRQSANHSPLDVVDPAPDTQHMLTPALLAQLQRVELETGDALYVPEGWWHQVESSGRTLAVNFWWESAVSRHFGGPMDGFYLRRLAQSLMERRKAADLADLVSRHRLAPHPLVERHATGHALPDAEPPGSHAPHGFFLSVGGRDFLSRRLAVAEEAAVAALLELAAAAEAGDRNGPLQDVWEAAAGVLASAAARSAEALMRVLCALRERHASAVAPLLLRGMGPAAWELASSLLERREEELVEQGDPDARALFGTFYDRLYGAVPDRHELLAAILSRKEAYAQEALGRVLAEELGVGQKVQGQGASGRCSG